MKVYGHASSAGRFTIELAGGKVVELEHSLTAYEAAHAVANALADLRAEKAAAVAVIEEAPKKYTPKEKA